MESALLSFAIVLALAFAGVPLGYVLLLVGICGFATIRGIEPALSMAEQQILHIATNHELSVLPLFCLMGAFIHCARLSEDLYDAANALVGHWRGGLAMATIGACAGFSAVSGSSVATAATMSRVAMPPMRRYRYAESLAAGAIAAGGTLGILIPPSVPMVIYGLLTETDIGLLFIAGIVPGLLLTTLFMASIRAAVAVKPGWGPSGERVAWRDRLNALSRVWPILVLFLIVLGGIYFGVFTPTEAAAIGALGAFAFALGRGAFSFAETFAALVESARITAMLFVVLFGALTFSNFITLTGMVPQLVTWIDALELSPLGVVAMMCVIYLILGAVFDSLAMLLLTVPIFFPIVVSLNLDPVWFGVVVIIVIEAGLISPPIGINVFVVRSVLPTVPLWRIYAGVWPFLLALMAALALVLVFPPIALFLPGLR